MRYSPIQIVLGASLLAGISFVATPAAAASQCEPNESKGMCCVYDDLLKRDVYASCGRLNAKVPKKAAAPIAAVPVALPPLAAPPLEAPAPMEAPSMPAPATDSPVASEPDATDALGNPGNNKGVGKAGETPGSNEPGSFGDGEKGRSDVADRGDRGSEGKSAGKGKGGGNGNGNANGNRGGRN